MIVGNGYLPGHAELALDLVRSDPALLERFSYPSPRRATGDMT